jgi:hypothetical protein
VVQPDAGYHRDCTGIRSAPREREIGRWNPRMQVVGQHGRWLSRDKATIRELLELAIAHAIGDKAEAAYRRGTMLAKRHQLMRDWERFCDSRSE